MKSKLKRNLEFNEWCEKIGEDLLKESILNPKTVGFKLRSHILNNEGVFYRCLMSSIEKELYRLKKLARKLFNTNKKEYVATGLRISEVNKKLKKYNTLEASSLNRTEYKLLKKFLKDGGNQNLLNEFFEQLNKDKNSL